MEDYDKRGHEYIKHDAVRPLFIIFIVPDQYYSIAKSNTDPVQNPGCLVNLAPKNKSKLFWKKMLNISS
jgi:hypothetical protein